MSEGIKHLSHSAVEEYNRCPYRFYLHRIERVPQRQILAGPAGSAFHQMTEDYDNGTYTDSLFINYLNEQLEMDVEYHPIRDETFEWWTVRGDEWFAKYVQWRKKTAWELVANEEEFSVQPEGLKLPFIGFIDRRFRLSTGHVAVVDIKTGIRMPSDRTQLNEYAAATRCTGQQADAVTFYDARSGRNVGLTWPIDWDEMKLVEHVAPVEKAILAGEFPPKASANNCKYCPYRDACDYKKG